MGRTQHAESKQPSFDAQIARLAVSQYGVFSRRQVARLGGTKDVIRHRMNSGRWEQVASHVFRLAGAPPSWRQSLVAACLAWGDGAVASHRAAAALWRFTGFEPGPVELTVPRGRQRKAPGLVHRNALSIADVATADGVAATTPARTLIDIASMSPRDAVEEALDDALRRGLVTIARLRWRLDALGGGRRGVGKMRELIDARGPSSSLPGSVFERRVLRMLRRAGLPEPVLQYRVRKLGRLLAVVDFAYPTLHLAIEADGYRWHSGRTRWKHDRRRNNELTLLGWRILHITWDDLTDMRGAVIDSIREAVAVRGGE
jgi:very-short-patch-repair endonuclease